MNKPLIIIGGSGHGSVIAECVNDNRRRFNDCEWKVVGFCNDFDSEVDGYPVLGKLSDIPKLVNQGYYFSWGIHIVGNSHLTANLFEKITIPDKQWATVVHKTAFVSESAVLEPGVFVMYNSYIAPRSRIGKCTMIKANTNIGHDVQCGSICHIAMGATVVSCSQMGYCATIAVNSTMLAHTSIGNFAILGAHSLLANGQVPNDEIYVGSPAKFLRGI